MDYIKSAHINNFGPWEDQFIELHPGVNCLVGESSHGKSAFLKALDFAINNQTPKSADGALGFITRPLDRGKIAEVNLTVQNSDSEHLIIRRRGKSTNEYQLDENKPQKALGRNVVPPEISKILNFGKINYHKQKELGFLLDETPGQVAKQLSDIINLQEIDQKVSHANSVVKEERNNIKKAKADLEEQQDKLNKLKFVQPFKAKVDLFIEKQNKFYAEEKKFNELSGIVDEIEILDSQIQNVVQINNLSTKIEQYNKNEQKYREESEKFDLLVEAVSELEKIEVKLKRCEKLIQLESKIVQLEQEKADVLSERAKLSQVKELVAETMQIDNKCKELETTIKKQETELQKLECPMCGRKG